jgi:protein-tyrosine phosphatase
VIDLHAHILPGLDDGAASIEEARELARRAAAEGVTAIAATPHVRDDYPTTVAQMEEGVERLRADFEAQRLDVEVLPGAEIAFERLPQIGEADLHRFSLGGGGRYLLLEFPYSGWPARLYAHLASVRAAGLVPVLAHPERNREVLAEPERLEGAVDEGALVQLTAASLDGRLGPATQRTAFELLTRGLVHLVASDAHGPSIRESGLADAVDVLKDNRLGRYLTVDAPAAVVAGAPLPERPPRRRSFRRR